MTTEHNDRDVAPDASHADAGADVYAALSSDLRGPVASIQSYVRTLISRDDSLTAGARSTIHQVILQQSKRLDAFLDDVVLYVRLLSHDVPVHMEKTMLAGVLEDVRQSSGQPDRVLASVPDVVVEVDRDAFVSALRRLVRNALVYGPRKSMVEVTADVREYEVDVTVRDSGRGIPTSQLAEAISPFVRAVGENERRRDGAGLGLAIASELALLVGGSLELRSADPGLAATITLPRNAG
jgi:K+-sensing histidine kinase KdpD